MNILRKAQQIFGSSAGSNQIAKFGSLAAGTPLRTDGATADPDVIQALSNYLDGWFAAVMGPNSPAIEDMNALCFLFSYQLSYLLQKGVPEWNAQTTYYTGNIVQDGSGVLYISLTNTNLNHALSDTTNWGVWKVSKQQTLNGTASASIPNSIDTVRFTGAGACTATFPNPTTNPGKRFTVKVAPSATGNKTISPNVDGISTILDTAGQFFTFESNGTTYEQVG